MTGNYAHNDDCRYKAIYADGSEIQVGDVVERVRGVFGQGAVTGLWFGVATVDWYKTTRKGSWGRGIHGTRLRLVRRPAKKEA